MRNLELTSGKSSLVFEESEGRFIPALYFDDDESVKKVMDGSSFLTLQVGDDLMTASIKKVNSAQGISFTGEFPGKPDWGIYGDIYPAGDLASRFEWQIKITYSGTDIVECRAQVKFDVTDTGTPRWMVPAMFYKDNRPESCVRKYPRYSPDQINLDEFVSNYWAFRSDRSSCPSVFCWTDNFMSCLATPESFSGNISGIGFKGDESGTSLMLNFPYVEEPVKYSSCRDDGTAPERTTAVIFPRGELSITFSTYVDERDLHLYDSLLRDIYDDSTDESNPWMTKTEADGLLAYDLYRWHYDKENSALYETSAFEGYFGKGTGQFDRQSMHVAWVSGIPYAYALWRYGFENNIPEYINAGTSIIDKVASEGVSPSGFFYSAWSKDSGWGTGWNPDPQWLQSRTTAEAVWFMIQSIEFSQKNGTNRQTWINAVRSNLDIALRIQRADGNFGTYYNVSTGNVEEWDGAGGLMWIPALLAGAKYFGNIRYREAALKAGEYYSKFVEDEYIYGAPEDVHLTPTSEDGYNAVIAYVHLYETTQDEKWLELAETAADWMASFRWLYNTKFPENTLLNKYDFRTIGGDNASPANNHLHCYGLICHSELLRLWEYTGDTYYLSRAADNLSCFHQFIARNDGDFNARAGMITEQWYHTDWTHPKGSMLQLAHSWCAGLILYANACTREYGDIIIDADSREIYVLDSAWIRSTEQLDPDLVLTLVNPSPRDLTLSVRHSNLGIVGSVTIGALEEVRVLIGGLEPKIEMLELEDMWSE